MVPTMARTLGRVCESPGCSAKPYSDDARYCKPCRNLRRRKRDAFTKANFNKAHPGRWRKDMRRLSEYIIITDHMFDCVEAYLNATNTTPSDLDAATEYRYRGWHSALYVRRDEQDKVRVPICVWEAFVKLQGKVAQGAESNSAGVNSNEQENGQTHSGRGAPLR